MRLYDDDESHDVDYGNRNEDDDDWLPGLFDLQCARLVASACGCNGASLAARHGCGHWRAFRPPASVPANRFASLPL